MTDSELFSYAKQLQVPIDLLRETAKLGRLPVVNFAAGGLGTEPIGPKILYWLLTWVSRVGVATNG